MKLFCECMKSVQSGHVVTALGNSRRDSKRRASDKVTADLSRVAEAKWPNVALQEDEESDGDIIRQRKSWLIPLDIKKYEPDQQLIFGWASIVEKNGIPIVDKQKDIIPVSELENAAYEFVLYSRDHGDMHARKGMGKLVESMVFTKEKQAALGVDLGQIGWWVGFKVTDGDLWAAHKRGDRPEFSIGGAAIPVEVQEEIGKGGRRFARFPFDGGAAGAVFHSVHRFLINQRHDLIHEFTNRSIAKSDDRVDNIVSVLENDSIILQNTVAAVVDHITRTSQRSANHLYKDLVQNPEQSIALLNNIDQRMQGYGRSRGAELMGRIHDIRGTLVAHPNAQYSINVTTNKIAKNIITKALRESWDVVRTSEAIDKSGIFGSARSKMIADTEINTAQNIATLLAGIEFNTSVQKAKKAKMRKLWTCGSNPCVICEENCGVVVELDEAFPSGDFSPSVHPNCMCEVELILI
jgi:hypothetical protein